MEHKFILHSEYTPSGDQPYAIKQLVQGIEEGETYQTLLGVTGSGKTFTIANVIEKVQKPTLIIIAGPNGSGKTSITHKVLQNMRIKN